MNYAQTMECLVHQHNLSEKEAKRRIDDNERLKTAIMHEFFVYEHQRGSTSSIHHGEFTTSSIRTEVDENGILQNYCDSIYDQRSDVWLRIIADAQKSLEQ